MSERNNIGDVMATLMAGFIDFIEPLKYFLLLGMILILADLRFGISAAKKRGEKIRLSRAGRRTLNKMVDYLCWILLAGALDKAFGIPFAIPVLPAVILLIIFGLEVNSCYSNYFEARGEKIRINIFDFFKKKTTIIDIEEDEDETPTE